MRTIIEILEDLVRRYSEQPLEIGTLILIVYYAHKLGVF